MPSSSTLYERVGGDPFFDTLTQRFYASVRTDPVLTPLYPAEDGAFEQARENLRDFLIQFWGGPATYSEQRGHPRLRMRHAPFAIGPAERDAWLHHMRAAVEASDAGTMERVQLLSYFEGAAAHMINT